MAPQFIRFQFWFRCGHHLVPNPEREKRPRRLREEGGLGARLCLRSSPNGGGRVSSLLRRDGFLRPLLCLSEPTLPSFRTCMVPSVPSQDLSFERERNLDLRLPRASGDRPVCKQSGNGTRPALCSSLLLSPAGSQSRQHGGGWPLEVAVAKRCHQPGRNGEPLIWTLKR